MNGLDLIGKSDSDAEEGIPTNSPEPRARSDSISLLIDELYRYAYGSDNDMSNPSQSPPRYESKEISSSDSNLPTPTSPQPHKQLPSPPRTPWVRLPHPSQPTVDGPTKRVTRLSTKRAREAATEASGSAGDQLPDYPTHYISNNGYRHGDAQMVSMYFHPPFMWTKLDVLLAVAEVAMEDWQDPKEEMTLAKFAESYPPGFCVKIVSSDDGWDDGDMNWIEEPVAEQESTAMADHRRMDVFRRIQEQVRLTGMELATGLGSVPGALSVSRNQPSSQNRPGYSSNYQHINLFDGSTDSDDSETSGSNDSTISDPNYPQSDDN